MPWETESASRLFSVLCCPGREREVIVGLQVSFINHRTRVRENKVSRSHGSWAINQTDAPQLLAAWRLLGIAGKKVWRAGAKSVCALQDCSLLRRAPICPRATHTRVPVEPMPSHTPSQHPISCPLFIWKYDCSCFIFFFCICNPLVMVFHACRIPNSNPRAPSLKLQVTLDNRS